jgi:hypothetical protein
MVAAVPPVPALNMRPTRLGRAVFETVASMPIETLLASLGVPRATSGLTQIRLVVPEVVLKSRRPTIK